MKALVYHGPGERHWESVPDPTIDEPTDVVVRIDSSTICGTDLHILKGDVPAVKPDKELLTLAEELIKRKAKPFDPKAFKDPYETALREVIDAKLAHRKPEQVEEPQLGAQVIDLMEALKRSVKGGAAAKGAKDDAPKKTKGKAKAKANGKGRRAA